MTPENPASKARVQMVRLVSGISATLKSAMRGRARGRRSFAMDIPADRTRGYPILMASRWGAQARAISTARARSVTSRERISSATGEPLQYRGSKERESDGRVPVHGHALRLGGELPPGPGLVQGGARQAPEIRPVPGQLDGVREPVGGEEHPLEDEVFRYPSPDEKGPRALGGEAPVQESLHVPEGVHRHLVGLGKEGKLEAENRVLDGGAVDRDPLFRGGRKDPRWDLLPDHAQELRGGDDRPVAEPPEDSLDEVLELGEGVVGDIDIVDAVDPLPPEFVVRALRRPVIVPAPDGLDHVMHEVRPGRDENVDVPPVDKVGHDPTHPRGNHGPGETQEGRGLPVPEHRLREPACLCKGSPVEGPGCLELAREFPGGHAGPDPHLLHRVAFHALSSFTTISLPPLICAEFPVQGASRDDAGQKGVPRTSPPRFLSLSPEPLPLLPSHRTAGTCTPSRGPRRSFSPRRQGRGGISSPDPARAR